MTERPTLTTTAGAPIADNQNAITAGPRGPVLMHDYQLLEKLAPKTASASLSAWCTPKAGAPSAR